MKGRRTAALILLIAALIAIIGTGFYLSVTHQETHPSDSSTPDGAAPDGKGMQ
jgi:hypothetical protein